MSNQPVIFDILYTPYKLPKSATEAEINAHTEERAFYDMTGETNIFDYITTDDKLGNRTMFEYLQKSTGVFNGDKMLTKQETEEMKARLKMNEGNIWHGFISLNEEESKKIDTPEKCMALIKRTFVAFFKDAHLSPQNIDLMCALHKDRPHHLHIHFVFWEKEPKYKGKDGKLKYRNKGKIDKNAIDNMFVRLGLFLNEKKDRVYKSRDDVLKELKRLTAVKVAMYTTDEIREEIVKLAKAIPKTGKRSYGSPEMEQFRPQIDRIVQMLLSCDKRARKADNKFYECLAERERQIKNICGQSVGYANTGKTPEEVESELPKYHYKIDDTKIKIIQNIEEDYKRRQGNLVLNLAKFIKPQYFERKIGKKYKANDRFLKKRLSVSRKRTNYTLAKFISSFGSDSELLERDFFRRLQEIEEEMEREKKKNQGSSGSGNGETK